VSAWIVGLVAALAQDAGLETVRIGNEEVAVRFPAGARFAAGTPFFERDGFRYALQDGRPVAKFVQDGGWGDVRARWHLARQATARKPVPVLVVLVTRAYILDEGADGIVRQRRGAIERTERATVLGALAQMKAAVDGSTDGAADTQFHIVQDDDPVFLALNPAEPDVLDEARWLFPAVRARVNQAPFATDDGRYHGPFFGVFVIHAGLSGTIRRSWAGTTPLTAVPYFGFSQQAPDAVLGATLYEEFRNMAAARMHGRVSPMPGQPREFPTIDGGPLWKKLVLEPTPRVESLEAAAAPDPAAPPTTPLEFAGLPGLESAVLAEGVPALLAPAPGGFAPSGVVEGMIPSTQAPDPKVVGFHSVRPAAEDGMVAIERQGRIARGYVEFRTASDDRVALQVRAEGPEPWFATLVDSAGATAQVLLAGRPAVASELGTEPHPGPLAPADGQTHQVVLAARALGLRDVAAVRVGSGRDSWRFERDPGAPALSVSVPAPTDAAPSEPLAPMPPDARLAELAAVREPSPEAAATVAEALASPATELKVNALAAIARAGLPGFNLELVDQCRSALNATSFLAVRALARRQDPESRALLMETIERGPFEHGRRFALEHLHGTFKPDMAAGLSQMGARSWRTRLAGLQALAAIEDANAQILLAATLGAEPEPIVRLTAVQAARAESPLVARRLLYGAVNDPSEAVRLASLVALLDCPVEAIRADALRGVRDESPVVRLGLVRAIGARANEADRPALRVAVTDPAPEVRAAALDALARQPGTVQPAEAGNAASDPDPRVASAYRRLAAAKGWAQGS
jgi:hypothetical protein